VLKIKSTIKEEKKEAAVKKMKEVPKKGQQKMPLPF
jgi:hypothetical protein